MRDTLIPINGKDLTEEQRNTILEYHLFLKDKRNGTIKGREVSGGNKHRDLISKEDNISPKVATKSVLLTWIVDTE